MKPNKILIIKMSCDDKCVIYIYFFFLITRDFMKNKNTQHNIKITSCNHRIHDNNDMLHNHVSSI